MVKGTDIKKYIFFVLGIMVSGIGVGITKSAELGVSPIFSVPNFMSIKFPVLSIGNYLIIWNCILILGQIIILKRDFKIKELLQIPLSFIFGWFTDIGVRISAFVPKDIYAVRLFCVLLGTLVLAFGISVVFNANVLMNSGEAFAKAVSDRTGKDFGNVKILFDISNVLLALVLSLIFFNGKIVGMREGTLLAALLTGVAVKAFNKVLGKLIKAR